MPARSNRTTPNGRRAVIYARYSSENQREASIEDQREICRRYIERQGWTLIDSYEDAAVSGASRFRAGLARLMTDAEGSKFDFVVCEAIDRLGRKLADVADLFDRLTFRQIQVHATSIGLLTQMHVGIMGTMAQMTLSDLREKTRRGQLGRARAGRIPGGLAYGYAVVPPPPGAQEAGERAIKLAEAEIVRRIFREFAAGKSPRHIAHALNAEQIRGPDGRPWGDTTIRGQPDRGTGLLNNTLYIRRLSWNRCSYVKDPRTGRRIARVNDRAQWGGSRGPSPAHHRAGSLGPRQGAPAGHAAPDGRGHRRQRAQPAHRRAFLLSGLLVCGGCGGGYTIIGKDRYGCATRRGKAPATTASTITRQAVERRVLGGLRERMLTPDLVEEFVRAFEAELASVQKSATTGRRVLADKLGDVQRRLDGVLRAIENGAWSDSLQARLTELERSRDTLTAELSAADQPAPVVRLHPNAAAIYRAKVADLETSLSAPDIKLEASEALRALIDQVMLTPDTASPDALRVELQGDLATILLLASAPNKKLPGTSVPRESTVDGCGDRI